MGVVLVIRPEPGASATAQALVARGHVPLVAPLVELVASGDPLPAGPFDAIAVSSAEGARRAAAAGVDPQLPLYAVGQGSAAAARAAGFHSVTAAGGDAAHLAALLSTTLPATARILYAHGDPVSRDLRPLVPGLIPWRAYRQQPVERLPPEAAAALRRGEISHVLIYSAFQATVFARLVAGLDMSGVTALTMSGRVAGPLAGVRLADVHAADAPDEAAVFGLLNSLPTPDNPHLVIPGLTRDPGGSSSSRADSEGAEPLDPGSSPG